jgi:hypothetical protein
MTGTEIIILVLGIIIFFSIFRFILKTIIRIILLIIFFLIVAYFLLYWNGGILEIGDSGPVIEDLYHEYCHDEGNEVRCECIVKPVRAYFFTTYSKTERESISKNKLKSVGVLLKGLERNKHEIKQCLREHGALDEWDNFMSDIKELEISNKINNSLEELNQFFESG